MLHRLRNEPLRRLRAVGLLGRAEFPFGDVLLHGVPLVSRPEGGGRLVLGRYVRIYEEVGFYLDRPDAEVVVGEGSYLNKRTEVRCMDSVRIGARCAIAYDVLLTDTDNHAFGGRPVGVRPIVLEDRVWIGARATVLKGVTIGTGAVVAAGAVVTRDVPPRTLVAGNPARPVREVEDWV